MHISANIGGWIFIIVVLATWGFLAFALGASAAIRRAINKGTIEMGMERYMVLKAEGKPIYGEGDGPTIQRHVLAAMKAGVYDAEIGRAMQRNETRRGRQ